ERRVDHLGTEVFARRGEERDPLEEEVRRVKRIPPPSEPQQVAKLPRTLSALSEAGERGPGGRIEKSDRVLLRLCHVEHAAVITDCQAARPAECGRTIARADAQGLCQPPCGRFLPLHRRR